MNTCHFKKMKGEQQNPKKWWVLLFSFHLLEMASVHCRSLCCVAHGAAALVATAKQQISDIVAEKDIDGIEIDGKIYADGVPAALAVAEHFKLAPIDIKIVEKTVAIAQKITAESIATIIPEVNAMLTESGLPYLAADKPSIADAIIIAAFSNAKFDVKMCGRQCAMVCKWFQALKQLPGVKLLVTPPPKKEAAKTTSHMGTQGKRDLTGYVEGMKVCTRFPPEPSGYLHIGHIKACLLNEFFARQYGGKLILRFDDTNPAKEKQEFVDSITADLKTMNVIPDQVSYTSDYFDLLLTYAEKFIKEGKAYVETADKDTMRKERMELIESKCRSNTVEENLRLFEEMKQGTEEGQKYVMRAKIDMKSPNGVLRDPSIYRCIKGSHYRTGDKYKVYPLYDFCIPIIDAIEGVTHAFRSSEYHDRNALYNWIGEAAGVKFAIIEDFSRLNFGYVLLSKRKLQWFVDTNRVDGWNDPRFPTLQGLLRRGLTIEAMREFCTAQGASKALNLMEMDKLWAINKKILDPIVPRFTCIEEEGHYTMTITDVKETTVKLVPKHKKNAALGDKPLTLHPQVLLESADAMTIAKDEEFTLMDWGNVIADSIDHQAKTISAHTNPTGSFKNTKKFTWLPAVSSDLIPVDVYEFDHLITERKLEETQKFEDFVNPRSVAVTRMIGDANLRSLSVGSKIQLERKGYFIVEKSFLAGHTMTLHLIPDGDKIKGRKIDIKW
eukprot:TRINITY_DN22606_c0_g1_i1.p2 TRINITY_DN22606_c0_g1~~TRINITY_DN22606_c0_g1_i1.p2  ORF type:complete len:724 (-),score=241.23 TRINITY_DN22606_c0_g1_i1:107-2278(-)